MKKIHYILLNLFLFISIVSAQQTSWSADFGYFFDNTEFSKSKLVIDQTMSGMHVVPKLNISLDATQSIVAGVDVLMLSGASKRIQDFFPLAYYKLNTDKQQLFIGSFPRSLSISNYSDFLFADSINYFRPNLHGFYWNLGDKNKYFNIWLDWTGKQTSADRETFYAGVSSYLKLNKLLFAEFQSYLFHFAHTEPIIAGNNLCDNAQMILTAGLDSKIFNNNANVVLVAGIFAGYERERGVESNATLPLGFVAHLKFDTKYVGLDTKFYNGDARFIHYSKYGNQLYWGNAFLRNRSYMENKLFIKFLNNNYIQGKIALLFHVSQGQLMHEQQLTLNASIDKLIFRK